MILKQPSLELSYVLSADGELSAVTSDIEENSELLFKEEIQRAFCQGREEGERAGYAKAHEETHHLNLLLHTLATHLITYRKQLLMHLKPEVIELAIQIAQKFIRQELSHPAPFLNFLNALLSQAINDFGGGPLKLFLAPEDLANLKQDKGSFVPPGSLVLVADPKLSRGDCRIESVEGILNAEVSKQLNHLKMRLV